MKILLLVAGGRAGIDLLQSLLDKHPSISQLPGVFYWGDFIKDKRSKRFRFNFRNFFEGI